MRRTFRRILAVAPVAVVVSWLTPVAAHAGWSNHNETLVRHDHEGGLGPMV